MCVWLWGNDVGLKLKKKRKKEEGRVGEGERVREEVGTKVERP